MLKYYNYMVTFSEVPDEISLCINITGCPIRCTDCHSKFLWENIGKEITDECLEKIINENNDVTCICIMGGDSDIKDILRIVTFIKNKFPSKKICWYSGKDIQINNISQIYKDIFSIIDYFKCGPYIKEYGGLDSPNTNQNFYKIMKTNGTNLLVNITRKFSHENKDLYKKDR